MTSARAPLPTDIVALVSFDGRIYPNEAKPLDRLGLNERAHPLENALEQWFSFATGKQTWVSVRGATIRGLLSARRRAKRSAWEVEVLIDAADDEGVVLSLFARMKTGILKQGAERVFLRLDADSHLLDCARKAGFFPYCRETLYQLNDPRGQTAPDSGLRPREKNELFGVYQLYSHAVPANVRSIEGATFREWQAAQERWGSRPADYLLEEDGVVHAWLRLATGQIGRLYALAQAGDDSLSAALDFGLARLSHSESVLALVPEYNVQLAAALTDRGFQPVSSYTLLANRLAKPAEELVQEPAQNAITVS